jgi:hypothetical protein
MKADEVVGRFGEPIWERFGVNRGGRVWTLVESEAYC